MMLSPTLRTMLRGALIPLGIGILTQGVTDLSEAIDARRDELAELAERVELHRAALAGEVPLSALDEDDDEDQAAVEEPDYPWNVIRSVRISGERDMPEPGRRRRWPLYAVLGVGVGYVAARAAAQIAARAQLAATVAAARSSVLTSQPPAPGSPADLAARAPLVDKDALEWIGERCTTCEQPAAWFTQELSWRHVVPPHCIPRWSSHEVTLPAAVNEVAPPPADEDQAAEFPHTDTAAIGGPGDPYACQPCGWFAAAGHRADRALAATLHDNANHAAGLPGR